ncbi:hypothetical protein KJI95_07180 [Shewanella sp. JM162201]|uniref:Uncharacterized protein n=1 Tax=Shewanella jiangmenensis TaxID=2837387 RepID=A0ABS5V1F5_9GAMM|nr:hypothetical protein [Shewanella jiangmenensis]MBT1444307.1 hypothetical protein [Shewanella jiangmenensis]
MRLTIPMVALLLIGVAHSAGAGQVVVRTTDEPFDAFAVRDELARQHEWQEALRAEQQLQVLERLPVGCLMQPTPYRHFSCNGLFYRPYPWRGKEVFIKVPKP